ncbi:MAG: hypothetical protein ACK5V3_14255 [Bdellovibrionales bacterium]
MKLQIKSLFAIMMASTVSFAQSVTTQVVRLDAGKPVFMSVRTNNIGPEFQCHYGLLAGRNESAFPGILNSKELRADDNFNFSDTFEFAIVDVKAVDGFEFTSLVECWLKERNTLTSFGQFSLQLKQDKAGPVLFEDSFSGFIQQGQFDLWKSSLREVTKRIQFKIN